MGVLVAMSIISSVEACGKRTPNQLSNDCMAESWDFQDGEDVREGSLVKFFLRMATATAVETLSGSVYKSPVLLNHHIWRKLLKTSRFLSLF